MEDEKKCERKRRRFAARLKTSKGVMCTDVPKPYVVLCNAGQATGLEKENIEQVIKNLSWNFTVPKLVTEKGESHSFLIFNDSDSALLFLNTYNGKLKIDKHGCPIYMNFVENVPNKEIFCHYQNPKGLLLLNNFITAEEETMFIKLFDWTTYRDSNNLKNRQVKHYGYEFRYGSNDVDLDCPLSEKIPEICDLLWSRLKDQGIEVGVPDQLTVNRYTPGQGIPCHVDKHSPFGDTILSLSLGSSIVMDWKHHSGKHVPVVVPERTLLVMQDEARYDWQHGIQPRTWDPVIKNRLVKSENEERLVKVITSDTVARGTRISLTFRWTRSGPCQCSYKTLCDSATTSGDIGDELAAKLEELHVHQVYEQIAGHFSSTRHKPWPKVVQFMSGVPTGAVVLDLGCGNGKNIMKRNDIFQLGCERSAWLAEACRERSLQLAPAMTAECARADLLQAPLRECVADAVICVAVIHHFTTKSRRLHSIRIISKLLRSGGKALITVWAKDQTKSNYLCKNKEENPEEFHVTVGGLNLPVHENRTQFQHNDLLVPWKLRHLNENKLSNQPESTLLRYYHVFEKGELDELCKQIPDLNIESSFYEEGNWCVICRKI